VRRDLEPASETIDSLGGRCLGCGSVLGESVGCRLAAVPDEWSEVCLSVSRAPRRRDPGFLPASSLPHYSLGVPRLDSILRPLVPGLTIMVSGAEASALAELAAFRAQLPVEDGGLDSAVLFVDGGNRSDPYLFSSLARQRGIRPNTAMRRVANCRVFTMYQLADLVSERLVPAVADYAARLVVISDLLGTFNEPELEEREARRLLSTVEQGIAKIKKSALVLTTLASPNKYDSTVSSWADTVISLEPAGDRVRAELLKHPSRPPIVSSFKLSQLFSRGTVRAWSYAENLGRRTLTEDPTCTLSA
jgi:hypothetical protein